MQTHVSMSVLHAKACKWTLLFCNVPLPGPAAANHAACEASAYISPSESPGDSAALASDEITFEFRPRPYVCLFDLFTRKVYELQLPGTSLLNRRTG
jgi:hypothetical protein